MGSVRNGYSLNSCVSHIFMLYTSLSENGIISSYIDRRN
jgi:hypothetical protein